MDVKRVLVLVGGAAARRLDLPVQTVAHAATGKRPLSLLSQVLLAQLAARATIRAWGLKDTPFSRAWLAKLLQGNSRVTLPRGFSRRRITV